MAHDILKNELFESFANASDNIYIYVCDMQSDLSRWSKNSVDYFGLEGEYIEEAGPKWMEHIHPDDRAAYLKDIEAVFSGASTRHSCQYRAKNKYGSYVWLECKGSVISDDNGTPLVFAGLMTRLDNQNKYDPLTLLLTGYEMQKYDFTTGKGAILLIGINPLRKSKKTNGFRKAKKFMWALNESINNTNGFLLATKCWWHFLNAWSSTLTKKTGFTVCRATSLLFCLLTVLSRN